MGIFLFVIIKIALPRFTKICKSFEYVIHVPIV